MLYNRCTGIYKFGNNTYPRRIRRRSNLGHIFREKSASYGQGNTVYFVMVETKSADAVIESYMWGEKKGQIGRYV
jgi:hypothetical protein